MKASVRHGHDHESLSVPCLISLEGLPPEAACQCPAPVSGPGGGLRVPQQPRILSHVSGPPASRAFARATTRSKPVTSHSHSSCQWLPVPRQGPPRLIGTLLVPETETYSVPCQCATSSAVNPALSAGGCCGQRPAAAQAAVLPVNPDVTRPVRPTNR